ncbi:hypothetical protein PMAYCL1PPCAC_23065, partial [Pristionchus mayeri]
MPPLSLIPLLLFLEGAESGVEEEAEEEEEEFIGVSCVDEVDILQRLGGVVMSPLDEVEAPDEKWPEVSDDSEWSCSMQAGGCCCACCSIIEEGEPAA